MHLQMIVKVNHIIIIEKVICHEHTMQTSSPRVEFSLVPAHTLERESRRSVSDYVSHGQNDCEETAVIV